YLLEEQKLSPGHARAILSLPGGERQKQLAQRVVADGLSVRQTEVLAKKLADLDKEPPVKTPAADKDKIYYERLEKILGEKYGRKVQILKGKKKGKIELEYYNPQDLEELLAALGYDTFGGEFT
ncbi:MAG: stage 0 sporulation protein J, partial [Oscillospiraceae bacterium]